MSGRAASTAHQPAPFPITKNWLEFFRHLQLDSRDGVPISPSAVSGPPRPQPLSGKSNRTMAARLTNEPQSRPEAGDALIVIHDFQARSSDELSLSKGDRVELIERDDEFGDGWFLGRHLVSKNTGLFPEVYTRPAPKSPSTLAPSRPLPSVAEVSHDIDSAATPNTSLSLTRILEPATSSTVNNSKESSSTLSLKTNTSDPSMPPTVCSGSPFLGLRRLSNPSQDSQVLHETLNVINEHITDLRSTTNNGPFGAPTDSGSEYSTSAEQRMSYIQGEETDEEEDLAHTRPEVESWNPEDVAEYLFTAGVEKHHCEVFRDQEISGEVLLGMDQSSLFIKAFDLGSVGRRLKTWQKIKALQDEVSSHSLAVKGMARPRDYEAAPDDVKRTRSRTNTLTSPVMNRPASVQRRHLSSTQTPKASPSTLNSASSSPVAIRDSPTRAAHAKRPSAASVRELNHSRQHSSTDFRISGSMPSGLVPALTTAKSSAGVDGPHKKQPSFDRNWTLGSALSQSSPRPSSSAGFHDVAAACDADILQDSAVDLDRGYFSGTEADGRQRNVLRKRDSLDHSRKSSYIEEQRVRSATALSKHSRFGSVDSSRDGALSPAVQKYYGIQAATHRRTASTTAESTRPVPPAKDLPSPTVTNIEAAAETDRRRVSPTVAKHPGLHSDWFSAVVHKPMGKGRPGMRAISDKLTSSRFKYGDAPDLPPKDSCLVSPARTGSSTPSADPSLDLESPGTGKSSITTTTPGSKAHKKKGKKETSAYTRGLLNVSPLEAKKDADYYGWMRKKSSNLMTWKPRLFVLKGRRLAYYYSEEDDREKGLIDISFHRVLPADNEKLTGLHATITGAVGGPNIPAVNFLAGVSDASTGLVKGDDSIFIFKLMPPRAGLSRAVNFTKPKVHYFAVPNLQQGRLWMAALMKATIDRDDSQPVTSTYQQKTISLAKAKQMRHRPPALMNFEPHEEAENMSRSLKPNGLGILGESDSGVSGMGKLAAVKFEGSPMGADAREKVDSLPLQSP